MAAKRKKKAPGRNIRESERNTIAVKLRLDPETAEELRDLSADTGRTMSQVVDAALMALYRARVDLSHVPGAELVHRAFIAGLGGPEVPTGLSAAEYVAWASAR